jgi:hypothetical protein
MLSSCYLITYQHHCLCRAFVPVYLPIDLSISYDVLLICICGPCLRADRGIVPRSIVLVMGSSHHGHNAEHNSPPRWPSSTPPDRGHHELDLDALLLAYDEIIMAYILGDELGDD